MYAVYSQAKPSQALVCFVFLQLSLALQTTDTPFPRVSACGFCLLKPVIALTPAPATVDVKHAITACHYYTLVPHISGSCSVYSSIWCVTWELFCVPQDFDPLFIFFFLIPVQAGDISKTMRVIEKGLKAVPSSDVLLTLKVRLHLFCGGGSGGFGHDVLCWWWCFVS